MTTDTLLSYRKSTPSTTRPHRHLFPTCFGLVAALCAIHGLVHSKIVRELSRLAQLHTPVEFPLEVQAKVNAQVNLTSFRDVFPVHVPLLDRIVQQGPVPVVLYPYAIIGPTPGQAFQVAIDGIRQSPFMTLENDIHNFDPNVVWVVDESDGGYPIKTWCENLTKVVKETQQVRASQGLPTTWPIHFLQVYHDTPSMHYCVPVIHLVGQHNVKYFKRSVVQNRRWKEEENYVRLGEISLGWQVVHTPIPARTDIAQGIQEYLQGHDVDMTFPYENVDRPVDVVHFWPTAKVGTVDVQNGHLRFMISSELEKFGKEQNLNIFIGLVGDAKEKGRSEVNPAYIQSMMETKIHVVTQRDQWEDHYRLFEALISGALVMTDKMLTLPPGLQHGVSIIEYTSVEDLKAEITYYLEHPEERLTIAAKGKYIAMERHRSWHRMEEVIFGQALSKCDHKPSSNVCIFTVDHPEGLVQPVPIENE